ncbi:hypothetical protein [Bosea psychrotolerans]|uniref:Sugar lactone lactonase YvrE n=1 Tax=Bosea psychrotolerans TaxID=1871628 RepID=A0A2S4LY02_9HYPH|nr:hypothetical protein [Bosea psychrotolerans]POR47332.1 hypothetical protein CYD53_11916 [Bosea psychrotolerans]
MAGLPDRKSLPDRRSVVSGAAAGLLCARLSPAQDRLAPAQDRSAIAGEPPRYDQRPLSLVPNAQAIGRRYWVPGLNEGYVPQGLTVTRAEILVAAYRSVDPRQDNGLSRVFRLAQGDGRLAGSFDLPEAYGHPGGLAARGTTLFVANSGRLLALDLTASLRSGSPAIIAERRVDKAMGPSFLACDGDALWFGPFRRQGEATLYAVPLARVFEGGTDPLGPTDAGRRLPLPLLAQGATFDRSGGLWISESAGNRPGALHRLDPRSGAVLASYAAPGGIEDLGCASDGRLWAVSEAGSQRWSRWETFYPLVFEIDPGRLIARS